MPAFLPLLLAFAMTQAEPPEYNASDLPKVSGPRPPKYPDPAPTYSGTPMDAYIRRMARRGGLIDAVALPEGDAIINDKMEGTAGRKAYQATVQPGQTMNVRLRGNHEAWFVVKASNRAGLLEKGMVHHSMHACDPQTKYVNPGKEARTIFFIVDTTELNVIHEPYSLHVTVSEAAEPKGK
ncbi:MAG: hypothetical protein LBC63_09145 [Holophagales bacterium]|jgi:hypothetical protein|nr:hypothetical protein [Holophagales bacterium]